MSDSVKHSELLILIGRAAIVARRAERRFYQAEEIYEHMDSILELERIAGEARECVDELTAICDRMGIS